jgi:tRNA-2-methylthio-N6-dimethylallyladenosine synthase
MNNKHKIYIETYGCQMNLNDTQIVQKIMTDNGYLLADKIDDADVILLNTCSVRENAETKIYNKIEYLYHLLKKRKNKNVLGILGCMAERLGANLLNDNKVINLIVGPDEYRRLPELINLAFAGENNVAIDLSKQENYNDIIPLQRDGISAWISIMRGCNNFCSYCIVPYTRGRERSRSINTILNEVETLIKDNIKEITLLGQNVNSYNFSFSNGQVPLVDNSFTLDNRAYPSVDNQSNIDFSQLLEKVAKLANNVRIRFLTSHPRNMSSKLIDTIAKYDNICNYIHLPIQSGSNKILEKMNRKYSVEHYLSLIHEIKNKISDVAISTDIIAGYPGEKISDHYATLELMEKIRYSNAFMFRYSPRKGTKSYNEIDDVSELEKIRRLNEIINLQNKISEEENIKEIKNIVEILVENPSKKNEKQWLGKTKTAKIVIFDNFEKKYKAGDLIKVKIVQATSATLFGDII